MGRPGQTLAALDRLEPELEPPGVRERGHRSDRSQPGLSGAGYGRGPAGRNYALDRPGQDLPGRQRALPHGRKLRRPRRGRASGDRPQRQQHPVLRFAARRPVGEQGRRPDLDQGRQLPGRRPRGRRRRPRRARRRRGPELRRLRSQHGHARQAYRHDLRRLDGGHRRRPSLPQHRRRRDLAGRPRPAHEVHGHPCRFRHGRHSLRRLRQRRRARRRDRRRGLEAQSQGRHVDRHHARQGRQSPARRLRRHGHRSAAPRHDRRGLAQPQGTGGRRPHLPHDRRRQDLEGHHHWVAPRFVRRALRAVGGRAAAGQGRRAPRGLGRLVDRHPGHRPLRFPARLLRHRRNDLEHDRNGQRR